MIRMNRNKKGQGQAGFVVTAELLLITVILVLGLVTGMTKLRDQSIAELADTGAAIGAINQSYAVLGTSWTTGTTNVAETAGFAFADAGDGLNNEVGGDFSTVMYNPAPAASTLTTPTETPVVIGIIP